MILTPGSTSIIKHVFIQDSTSTSGAGKTGLLYSGVTAYYIRAGGSITALTMETISTIGTWASTGDNYLGMKLVNDTNMPGLYELDLPNNILVAGANQVTIMIKGTGIAPCNIEIQLKDVSNLSAILGTALTETSAGYLSAGVKKVFDVATPVFTAASLNQSKDVVTALTDLKLDKLIAAAGADTDVTDNSLLARMVSKSATADWTSYNQTTDSLEAIRDQGDAAWVTATSVTADVQTIKGQAVTCGAGVTINPNVGTTQPVNFTGTAASALVKSDMIDIASAAVSDTAAQIGVNVVQVSGDATAADNLEAACDGTTYNIGGGAVVAASVTGSVDSVTDAVAIQTGTGAGQLDITSGVVKSNLVEILGTALTETGGLIAAAFKKFFNVATPTGTVNSIPDAVAGATGGLAIVGSAVAVSDKTGFALTTDYDAAKTAATQASVNAIPTTPLLAGNYTAPDNASIASIKTVTDQIRFTITNQIDANALTGGGGGGATAEDVWTYQTRGLTDKAGFTISGTKTTLDALNDIAAGAAMTLTQTYDAAKTAATQASVNAIPTTPLLAGNYVAPDNADIGTILTMLESATYGLNALLTAIGGQAVEGAITRDGVLRLLLSAVGGNSSGLGTGLFATRNQANSKNRLAGTYDSEGNRTMTVVDGT